MEFLIPLLLVLVGLGLIAVEVYVVPGFGAVGIGGGLAIVAGVVYAFVTLGPAGGVLAALGSVGAGAGLFYFFWQTGAWDRFVLAADLRRDKDADAREHDTRSRYLGRDAVAVTPLRPGGIVEIDGERVEVQTEGEFIASGSTVRVVAMDRRRFFVRLADALPEAGADR
ncbi:MAG: NfeD family protein [Bacteroidota bacterium]